MKLNYFNFKNFKNKVLMTNDFGKYMFVEKEDFQKIVSLRIDWDSSLYSALIEKEMIFDESELEYSSASKYALRTIKGHVLAHFCGYDKMQYELRLLSGQ